MIRSPVTHVDAPILLSKTLRAYLSMLTEIKALGGDIEPYIEDMGYRTYKKIEPFLYSGKQLQADGYIIDKLLSVISDIFIIADVEQEVKENEVDVDEFVDVGTDLPIPFD